MTVYFAKRKVLLIKPEVTYATDPVPTGAANAFEARNFKLTSLQGTVIKRDVSRTTFGNDEQYLVGTYQQLDFEVPMQGSGTAGVAPAFGAALKACGMLETVVEDTSVTYTHKTGATDSIASYYNLDGVNNKMLGARGDCTLMYDSQQFPWLQFSFYGLYVDPAAVTLPVPVFTAWQKPSTVSLANTVTASLQDIDVKLKTFSYSFKNSRVARMLANQEEILITDRAPEGSLTIQTPLLGTVNWKAVAKTQPPVLGTLSIVHGTADGLIATIGGPKVQVLNVTDSEEDDVAHQQLGLNFARDAGDDEFSLTFT